MSSIKFVSSFALLFCVFVNGMPQYGDNSVDEDCSTKFKFYSKEDWKAEPATDFRPLIKPVEYVIIHHTYVPGACNTTEECKAAMRSMQRYHMSLKWGDIGYHFCVGSEGGAYEGRGWDIKGIHAGKANAVSVGICLIGDYRKVTPSDDMLTTTKRLIEQGVNNGAISLDYKLIGHGQVMATECPGEALQAVISTWDHYHSGPFEPV